MTGHRDVVIVGAGISGLTVAYYLRRAGVSLTVLDPGDAPGGTMQTLTDGGWMVETGPNSALETTPLFGEMFDGLGIAAERAKTVHEATDLLKQGLASAAPMLIDVVLDRSFKPV